MLVDLPQGWDTSPDDPYAKALRDFGLEYAHITKGHYVGLPDFAFDHLVETEYPFQGHLHARSGTDEELRALLQEVMRQEREDTPQDYGVCDHPGQVVERWPQLMSDPRPFIIVFAGHLPDSDWKPEKHGKYIGTNDPWREPVYHFHLYQLRSAA